MDWFILSVVLIGLIITGIGISFLRRFIHRTRSQYQQYLPAVRIINLSMMKAEETITLTPELENIGPGVAYDCLLQLSGWDGNFSVKAFYPKGPRYQTHTVPIVLGPNAPIRMKPISRCYVRLAYRDCWEQRYECWYPVVQTPNVNSRLYTVHIDLANPEFTEPHPSVSTMWKFLRRSPAPP